MQQTFKPWLVVLHKNYLVVKIIDREYTIDPQAWEQIEGLKFYYDPSNQKKTHPIAFVNSRKTQICLPSIIFGSRCYNISSDPTDLRLSNLTTTCKIENLKPGLIKVWIGNGNYFLTDEEYSKYVSGFKWSQIELKQGYPYICRRIPKGGLELFHRVVAGATEPDQHVDHMDWNTIHNTKSNLQILTMAENIHRCNPSKKGVKRHAH